jgi:hypothetical protein
MTKGREIHWSCFRNDAGVIVNFMVVPKNLAVAGNFDNWHSNPNMSSIISETQPYF